MDTLLEADIFFFISSIGFVIVTVVLLVTLYFIIKAVQEVRAILHIVRGELEHFKAKRRDAELRLRTAEKWLGIMSRRWFSTKKNYK